MICLKMRVNHILILISRNERLDGDLKRKVS